MRLQVSELPEIIVGIALVVAVVFLVKWFVKNGK